MLFQRDDSNSVFRGDKKQKPVTPWVLIVYTLRFWKDSKAASIELQCAHTINR